MPICTCRFLANNLKFSGVMVSVKRFAEKDHDATVVGMQRHSVSLLYTIILWQVKAWPKFST